VRFRTAIDGWRPHASATASAGNAYRPRFPRQIDQGSFQFTADTAQTTLSFSALNGTCCYGAALDNVRVTGDPSALPEPASALLVVVSLAGLGWSRRQR